MALSNGTAPHTVVWEEEPYRIVCMDSMGHADHRLTPYDVIVAGSHSAACATQLVLHLRLAGVIGHSAGPGLREGGIAGLELLDRAGVPGASVSGESAPISNGVAMYRDGIIAAVNDAATALGVSVGDSVQPAAERMALGQLRPVQLKPVQHVLRDDDEGKVIGIDTIAYGDDRINGTVLVMGSHSGQAMADYLEPYSPIGTITNDAGDPVGRSGVLGMDRLAERGIPSAVVSGSTAEVGNGVSTYEEGVISQVNAVAAAIGVVAGQSAREAADLILRRRP